jgi:hypothetical protein
MNTLENTHQSIRITGSFVTPLSVAGEEKMVCYKGMTAFFKNAPIVSFLAGDPAVLSEVQTVELGVWGDRDLADRLNHSLVHRKLGVLGFPVDEQVLKLGDCQVAASR